MSSTAFRYLLCILLVTGTLGATVDFMIPSLIPESIAQAQSAEDAKMGGLSLALVAFVGLAVAGTFIPALFGLFNFRPWAPRLALISAVLTALAWPAMGINVYSGWAAALNEIATVLWGAVLALAYFSPLKEKFRAP